MSWLGVLGVVFLIFGMWMGYMINKEKEVEEVKSKTASGRPSEDKQLSPAELKAMERWFIDEDS